MTNLSPEICLKLKEARRAAKLSQSVVAAEVGCKQSALSMFEQGDGTKLNDDVIAKLAKKFNVELDAKKGGVAFSTSVAARVSQRYEAHTAFCPNPNCPTNHRYTVDGIDRLLPDLKMADPVGGKFCALCGEVLERRCPNCGAPVHEGAICSLCGDPYLAI